MKKNIVTRSDILLLIMAVCFFIIFEILYSQLFPEAALRLSLSEDEISEKAHDYLRQAGYSKDSFELRPSLRQNVDQIHFLQQEFGLSKCNEIIRQNRIPVYYWSVTSKNSPPDSGSFNFSYKNDEEAKKAVQEALTDTITLHLTTDGRLIEYRIKINQPKKSDSLRYDEAFNLAERFLNQHKLDSLAAYKFVQENEAPNQSSNKYSFQWENESAVYNEQEQISLEISHSRVTKYALSFKPSKIVKKSSKLEQAEEITAAFIFVIIMIFFIILLIQKLRQDSIDLKSNIGLGVVVACAWAFMLYANIYPGDDKFLLSIILPLAITTPFIFMAFVAASSIAESENRDVWAEKLFTIDLAKKGRLFFPEFSMAILRGLALAFLAAGTLVILLKVAALKFSFFMNFEDKNIDDKFSLLPILYVTSVGILNTSFGEFIFRCFFVSWFRKKFRSLPVIMGASVLLWIFAFGGYAKINLSAMPLNLIINLSVGFCFIYFFIKYDFLTVWWGAFAYYFIRELNPFINYDNSFLLWNGIAMWIFLGTAIILAIIGLFQKSPGKQVQLFIPEYIKRQKERERINREIEIARNVQLSFLPRRNPATKGMEIASICIPATEVGGDYFDFIQLADDRLGVVIGDVSGKGISAAFHMTLTKGFLKSQAKSSLSPREVLINLNELFYENVERGTFISMIYGIFDLKARKLTFARAGHNPILLKKGSEEELESLCPKGLALGLDKGDVFAHQIDEYTIGIDSNDVLLFYTDGFSEAMNQQREEFGEHRLQEILARSFRLSAENIINEVKAHIFDFVGTAEQHDDMTMIVIRIN